MHTRKTANIAQAHRHLRHLGATIHQLQLTGAPTRSNSPITSATADMIPFPNGALGTILLSITNNCSAYSGRFFDQPSGLNNIAIIENGHGKR